MGGKPVASEAGLKSGVNILVSDLKPPGNGTGGLITCGLVAIFIGI
jgi:hypothetical protein